VGYFVTVFDEELRDSEHFVEQLHAGRYHPGQGLPVGELRPYDIDPAIEVPAN
jgi:hypothetical protein